MEAFKRIFKGKGRAGDKREENTNQKPPPVSKPNAGWKKSKSTVLVNDTDRTLVLQDKIGSSYGKIRYEIPKKDERTVNPVQHTFFRMLAYAVMEEPQENKSEQQAGSSEKKEAIDAKAIDTKLSIDSDQLADHRRIVISLDAGGKYKLTFE